ncbi:MAG: hypothetical protein JNK85_28000 [Verrucomicrobiales bacterium]|nr:hypothetical protein [Verrucomicrobiales bacterium]
MKKNLTLFCLPILLTSACSFGQSIEPEDFRVGLNFGSDEVMGTGSASLSDLDEAGVPHVAQRHWNNLKLQSGTNATIVASRDGRAEPTGISVIWSAAGTWSSTGRGGENNLLLGRDKVLMTGFLDTTSASTTTVKIAGLPTKLTEKGYDVYVYALAGLPGLGGSYRIIDPESGKVLRDSIRAQSPPASTSYMEVAGNLGATTNGPAALIFGTGNYLVFRGLTARAITVEARTDSMGSGIGFGNTPRAPINAIQLVSPSSGPPIDDITRPGDPIAPTSQTSRSPDDERVQNAIDNDILTKFLDFNDNDVEPPFSGWVGLMVRTTGRPAVVTGLALTSANDAPERDPASYRLEGSSDGIQFTLIAEGQIPAFSRRYMRQEITFQNTRSYTSYQITFPTVANPVVASALQIAEVELLGIANDVDMDGLPDSWEVRYFGGTLGEEAAGDPDKDSLTNGDEYEAGTDPAKADTDGDGFWDRSELRSGSNPLDPKSFPVPSLRIAVQQVRIEFPSAAGAQYRVERSSDMVRWATVEELSGTGETVLRVYNTEGVYLYFRVVQP